MLGKGSYFARNPLYSMEYGGRRPVDASKRVGFQSSTILMCNVLVGDPFFAGLREPRSALRPPLAKKGTAVALAVAGAGAGAETGAGAGAGAGAGVSPGPGFSEDTVEGDGDPLDSLLDATDFDSVMGGPHIPPCLYGYAAEKRWSTVHVVHHKSCSLVQYVIEFYSKRLVLTE